MPEAGDSHDQTTAMPSTSVTQPEPSASGPAGSSSRAEEVRVGEERKDSCTPKFDALWFCYCEPIQSWARVASPTHPSTAL